MTIEQEQILARIKRALSDKDHTTLREALGDQRAADIAETFEIFSDEDRSRILFALNPHTAAEVVIMLGEAIRSDLVDDLDTESLTEILSELQPDDAVDILGELDEDEAEVILEHMEAAQSDKLGELLEYAEDTAGGIMTPEILVMSSSKTVADAVEEIRAATQDEDLHEIYIVDDAEKLMGTIPLRRLVTSQPTTMLSDICQCDPVYVFAHDDQETVVQIIRKYDVVSAAVVDESGKVLGLITHDDLLDVAEEEAAEDIYRMAGTDAAEFESSSILNAARVRLTWLLPCMLGMLLTASVLAVARPLFDRTLFISLGLFVPMIGAMGGNSGIQISTVIVRGFATGELVSTKFMRAFAREGRIAVIMSIVCGLAAWCLVSVALPWFESMEPAAGQLASPARFSLAVASAMTCAILVASVLGLALPFTFRRLGIDPAIASGPLVTTTNDVVSVTVYMLLAMLIAQ